MDLSTISSLSADQLSGWHAVVTHPSEPWGREPQPGEMAAILHRARHLGVTLSAPSSRAGLFGSATAGQTAQGVMSVSTRP